MPPQELFGEIKEEKIEKESAFGNEIVLVSRSGKEENLKFV